MKLQNVTKLIILMYKNLLFTDKTNWFVGYGQNSLLPSPDFPVVFHNVNGKFEKFGDETR